MNINKTKKITIVLALVLLLAQLFNAPKSFSANEIQIYDSLDSDSPIFIAPSTNLKDNNQINSNQVQENIEEINNTQISSFSSSQESIPSENKSLEETILGEINDIGTEEEQKNTSSLKIYENFRDQSLNILETPDLEIKEGIFEPISLKEIKVSVQKNIQEIDLPTSIDLTLSNNSILKEAFASKEKQKWIFSQTLASMLPDVSLAHGISYYQGSVLVGGIVPVTVTQRYATPSLIGNFQAFNGFRNFFNTVASKHQYNAAKQQLQQSQEEKIYEVTESYYRLLKNKVQLLISEKALQSSIEQYKINNNRFNAGVGTKFDVLQSKSALSNTEQKLIEADKQFKLSMVLFSDLLGIDLFTELLPSNNYLEPNTLIPDTISLDELIEIALLNRPEVKRDREYIKSLIAQKRSTYSQYLPKASVSGGLQGNGETIKDIQRSEYIAINLSWEGLTDLGLSGILQTKKSTAEINEAKARLNNTIRTIQKEIIDSYYSRSSAQKLIKASKNEFNSSKEGLRLAEIRLRAGVGTNTDLITSQLTFTNSQSSWLNSVIDFNLNEAKLLKYLGIINKQNLLEGISRKNVISLTSIN